MIGSSMSSKSIVVFCDGLGFSLVNFIKRLTNEGFTVDTLIFDARPIKSASSVKIQTENKKWSGQLNKGQTQHIRIITELLRHISIRILLACMKVKIIKVVTDFSQIDIVSHDALVLYSSSGLLSSDDLSKIEIPLINIHPAKLPEYRGLDSHLWAKLEGSKQGVSGYVVDKGVDTGPIIQFEELPNCSNIPISELKAELNKFKYLIYPKILALFFIKKEKLKPPLIHRRQNRGVFQKKDYLKLIEENGDTARLRKSLCYVSPSKLKSIEANLIHVIFQCNAFTNYLNDVDVFLDTELSSTQIHTHIENEFGKLSKDISWVRSMRVSKFRQFNIAVSALLHSSMKKYDLIVSRNLIFSFLISFFRSHIFEFHTIPTGWRGLLFSKVIKSQNVTLVCISNGLKQDVCQKYGVAIEKIKVFHDAATDVSQNEKCCNRLDNNAKAFSVGYFGHLHTGRGIEIIEALARHYDDVQFNVYGGDPDAVDRRRAKNYLCGNIQFHGHVSYLEARRLMRQQNVLLLPYQRETFLNDGNTNTSNWMSPLKLFEYMSSSVPLVASDLSVLREVITDNINCILAEPDQLSDWISALERLKNDSGLSEKLAKNAFEKYKREYSWEARAKRFLLECM